MTDQPRIMIAYVVGREQEEDRSAVFAELDRVHERFGLTHVIHNNLGKYDREAERVIGVARLAGDWATRIGVQEVRCPRNARVHGSRSGECGDRAIFALMNPARDIVVAFPGGRRIERCIVEADSRGFTIVPAGVGDPS